MLSLSLASVQCTKGKCAKSFHVTCALQEGSGIFLDATIPDAEHEGESVSILEQAKSSEAAAQPFREAVVSEEASTVAPATTMEGGPAEQAAPSPPPAAAPPAASTEASNSFVHLTILCRTHNPVRRIGLSRSSSGCVSSRSDRLHSPRRTGNGKKPNGARRSCSPRLTRSRRASGSASRRPTVTTTSRSTASSAKRSCCTSLSMMGKSSRAIRSDESEWS